MSRKRAQVWVETVIYTTIAFGMIAIVLTFAKPKIENMQDKAIIDQSYELIRNLDNTLTALRQSASGNQRAIEIYIKKGSFEIDALNEKIKFVMDTGAEYSELGESIEREGILITTEKGLEKNKVTLEKDYSSELFLSYNGQNQSKLLEKSSIPYKFVITNLGSDGDLTKLDVRSS